MYEAILHFEDYPLWWPKKFRPQSQSRGQKWVGDRLVFSPLPGVKTGWEITAVEPPEQIQISYFRGFHSGRGVWRFESKEQATLISFEMLIAPKNPFFGLVYGLANVPRRHSAHMWELFVCLEGYLEKQQMVELAGGS